MVSPEFDPVALHIGPLAVRWYGLMYLARLCCCMVAGAVACRATRCTGLRRNRWTTCCLRCTRRDCRRRIGYTLFYNFDSWLDDPLQLFRIWEGGMSFHGGFLGVLVAMWWYGQRIRTQFFSS